PRTSGTQGGPACIRSATTTAFPALRMSAPRSWAGPSASSGGTTPTAFPGPTPWSAVCRAPSAAERRRPFPRRRPADNRIVVSVSWPQSVFILLLAMGLGWLTVQPVAASDGAVLSGPLEIRIIGANSLRAFVALSPEDRRAAAALLNQVGGALE